MQASSRLVSHVWAKCKDEVPDVSGYNKNIEKSCESKLKLAKRKDLYLRSTDKLAKER